MTPERIDIIVKKLRQLAGTNYSDYAGFHLEKNSGEGYHDCFVVNDQKFHSSNLTLELENFEDAIKIVQRFTGQSEEEVMEELNEQGPINKIPPIYLHYLKLLKACEE